MPRAAHAAGRRCDCVLADLAAGDARGAPAVRSPVDVRRQRRFTRTCRVLPRGQSETRLGRFLVANTQANPDTIMR